MLSNWGAGEDSWESFSRESKEIKSILKEINPEYSFEGLKLNFQYFWPPDAKSQLIEKDPDAEKEWRREEKGMTEDEMVGWWHHRLNEHEFGQALGVGDGEGSLACCGPCGHKESDTTEPLNWTES